MECDLKHIFVIQSSITEFSSKGVIKLLNLKGKNILLVTIRGYKLKFLAKYESIDQTNEFNKLSELNIKKTIGLSREVESIYKFWKTRIQVQYVLYVPQVASLFFQILSNFGCCEAINYIEEGMGSRNLKFVNGKLKERNIVKKLQRQILGSMINLMLKRYGINLKSNFIDIDKNSKLYLFKLNDPVEDQKYVKLVPFPDPLLSNGISDNSIVLILSPLAYVKGVSQKEEIQFVTEIVSKLKEYKLKIYVKLHPVQIQLMQYIDPSVYILSDSDLTDFSILPTSTIVYSDFTSMVMYLKHTNPQVKFYNINTLN